MLLWIWCRPAAKGPIGPLTLQNKYAASAALKRKKKKKKKKKDYFGVPIMAQWLTNPTRNHEVAGLIAGIAQWVKDPVLP